MYPRPTPTRRQPPRSRSWLAGAALLLCACSNYEVRFNDRIVYTPAPLFADYDTADAALADCLAQAIADQKAVQAGDLKALNCSRAGIRSLNGLATFDGLEYLDLSHNRLDAVAELASLPALLEVDLAFNDLVDVSALSGLSWLERVDLRGNARLSCGPARRLAGHLPRGALLPEHCSRPR